MRFALLPAQFISLVAAFIQVLLNTMPAAAQETAQPQTQAEIEYQSIIKTFAEDQDKEKAIKGFKALIESNPSFSKSRYNLALIEASEHHWNEALKWMDQYGGMVDAAHQAKAIKLLTLFVQDRGTEFSAALHTTLALLKDGKTEEAATMAAKLQDIDDSQPIGSFVEGMIDYRLKNYKNAEKVLQDALTKAPDAAKPRILDALTLVIATRAKAAGDLGKYTEAGILYEKAWHYEPQHPEIGLAAAYSDALGGRDKEGSAIAQSLAQNTDPDVQTKASNLLAKMGQSAQSQ